MGYMSTIANDFVYEYTNEYGSKKLAKVLSKVENSRKTKSTLKQLENLRIIPNHNDIVTTILSIPYFMFANKITVAMGCVFLIELWDEQINNRYHIAGNSELASLHFDVKNNCGRMV